MLMLMKSFILFFYFSSRKSLQTHDCKKFLVLILILVFLSPVRTHAHAHAHAHEKFKFYFHFF